MEDNRSASTLDLKKAHNNTTTSNNKRSLGRVFSMQNFNNSNGMFRDSQQQNGQQHNNKPLMTIKDSAANSYTQSSIDISTHMESRDRLRRVLSTPEGSTVILNVLMFLIQHLLVTSLLVLYYHFKNRMLSFKNRMLSILHLITPLCTYVRKRKTTSASNWKVIRNRQSWKTNHFTKQSFSLSLIHI